MNRRDHAGGLAIVAIVLAASAAALAGAFFWRRASARMATAAIEARAAARQAAESGIAEALACLNGISEGGCGGISGPAHAGERDVALEGGAFRSTSLTDLGEGRKSAVSVGRAPAPDGFRTVTLSAEFRTGRIVDERDGVLEVIETDGEPVLDSWKRVPGSTREAEAP